MYQKKHVIQKGSFLKIKTCGVLANIYKIAFPDNYGHNHEELRRKLNLQKSLLYNLHLWLL